MAMNGTIRLKNVLKFALIDVAFLLARIMLIVIMKNVPENTVLNIVAENMKKLMEYALVLTILTLINAQIFTHHAALVMENTKLTDVIKLQHMKMKTERVELLALVAEDP